MSSPVSIIVCTHNRCAVLGETIACLIGQMRGMREVELIVVDSASTDQTAEVAQSFAGVRYCHEAKAGLSLARNRGVREARHERLIFVDDDIIPAAGWLEAYRQFFEQCRGSVAFWGGVVAAHFEGKMPSYPEEDFIYIERAWSLVDPGPDAGPIRSQQDVLPIGANFGALRSVLMEVPFDSTYGRDGKGLGSCEETDVFYRLMAKGLEGAWVPGASVLHRVPANRVSLEYLAIYYFGHGQSYYRLKGNGSVLGLLRKSFRHGWALFWSRVRFSRKQPLRHFVKWHYYRGALRASLQRVRTKSP